MNSGLGNIMKQAQQMQANLQQAQQELGNIESTGQAGGGMVSVVMTGRHEVLRVSIEPQLLQEDKEMLEDLLAAAINDAVHKTEKAVQEKMSSVTAGMGLPDGMKMPF